MLPYTSGLVISANIGGKIRNVHPIKNVHTKNWSALGGWWFPLGEGWLPLSSRENKIEIPAAVPMLLKSSNLIKLEWCATKPEVKNPTWRPQRCHLIYQTLSNRWIVENLVESLNRRIPCRIIEYLAEALHRRIPYRIVESRIPSRLVESSNYLVEFLVESLNRRITLSNTLSNRRIHCRIIESRISCRIVELPCRAVESSRYLIELLNRRTPCRIPCRNVEFWIVTYILQTFWPEIFSIWSQNVFNTSGEYFL